MLIFHATCPLVPLIHIPPTPTQELRKVPDPKIHRSVCGKGSRDTPPQYYSDCAVLQATLSFTSPTVWQAISQLSFQPSVLALK